MCALQAVAIECPQCGAPIQITERICSYCNSAVYVKKSADIKSAVNKYIKAYQKLIQMNGGQSVEGYVALGICHLQNRMYDNALASCEKAIELLPDDGEAYYYAALALFKGKRPYLQTISNIKKIVSLLDVAASVAPMGKYYYLLYLIQCDFYDKKRLKNGRTAGELLEQAQMYELDDEDIDEVKQFAGNV